MKKFMFVAVLVVLAASFALAQQTPGAPWKPESRVSPSNTLPSMAVKQPHLPVPIQPRTNATATHHQRPPVPERKPPIGHRCYGVAIRGVRGIGVKIGVTVGPPRRGCLIG